MPSKGRYTAGKQVSRWEADTDNIDIEYKNLEGQPQSQNQCVNCTCSLGDRRMLIIKILTVTAVFGIGLVLGYLVRRTVDKNGNTATAVHNGLHDNENFNNIYGIKQDYDREFSRLIQADLEDLYNYEDHMKIITSRVHISGIGSTNTLLHYVEEKWRTFPFDSVRVKHYNVTLSYPNYTNIDANMVTVQAANGTLIFRSQYNTSSSHPEYLPFNAYSPSGIFATPKVVYGHYARKEDFEELERQNVSLNGSIVIARYGHVHPASKMSSLTLSRFFFNHHLGVPCLKVKDKVKNAEKLGVAGVILYSDPADYSNNQTSDVYPDSWWLPGWAIQLAHVRYDLIGDPRTPDFSSITGVQHDTESKTHFSTIPVLPIRYDDARYLLSDMLGPVVKNEWFGGLNITYRTGPGYVDDRQVILQVDNMIQERNISNILAIVKGHYESDKYVIIGAHIDSWIQGAVDSGSGYTVLQELARTFAYHINNGWKPRRSIIFALWDASKYGNIGSHEWVQEQELQLAAGAVAYINLDSLIQGNHSFSASASPVLFSLIMEATKTVLLNCSSCTEISTVFDQWVRNFPQNNNDSMPKFEPLGDGSDHSPFIYRLGVPVLNPRYTYNHQLYPNLPTYPAFGALEDTKEYMEKFIDPNYTIHITTAKVLADVILRLADKAVLPFDIRSVIDAVLAGKTVLNQVQRLMNDSVLQSVTITSAIESINHFVDVAMEFNADMNTFYSSNVSEFDVNVLNNKLILLTRAFVHDNGLPGNSHYRNVLSAPDDEDLQRDLIFPGIILSLRIRDETERTRNLQQQISLIVLCLNRATDILRDTMIT